ncbi:MAG: TIGR00725 family protein [Brevinematia bacterium]
MSRKIQITVIGDSKEIEKNNQIAYEVGKFIAQKGWILITGGKEGVMNACSKGAIENNGIVVSILPDEDLNNGTPYKTISIATGIGYARNSINVLSADVVVVIGGASGTLSEIAYAWAYNKPIIAYKDCDGWSSKLADTRIDYRRNDRIIGVSNLEELKEQLEAEVNKILKK